MANGYTYALTQSSKVVSVENFSMGGSISLLASVTAKGVDFSKFDVCLLDFAVNEVLFMGRGISAEDLYAYERAVAGAVLAAGCLPVILVFPRQYMGQGRKIVLEHHLRLAQELNLPYFDAITYLEDFTATKGIDRATIFKDGGHLARWFAIALGHQLAEGLERLLRDPVEFIDYAGAYNLYRSVRVAGLMDKSTRVYRRNSLFQFVFGRLQSGDKLRVEIPDGCSVCGIWANFGSTAGIIRLNGRSEALIDLRNGYQCHGRSPFTVLTLGLPTAAQVQEADGAVTVEVVPLEEIPAAEARHIYKIEAWSSEPPDLGVAELGGLIVKDGRTKAINRVPARHFHVDLARIIQSTAIEAAVDIFLSHSIDFPRRAPE